MGFSVSPQQVRNGFKKVYWPCRFEIVNRDPLIVLDGAHNVDSISRLIETINKYISGRKVILIFGVSVDKDVSGILELLLPKVERAIFVKSEHPRAADPAMLVELGQWNENQQESAQNVAAAVKRAIELADENTAILITGSLFIAADARKIILKIVDRTSS
jgi:dihydrofolate synthase/folylpolyglutamate synthase